MKLKRILIVLCFVVSGFFLKSQVSNHSDCITAIPFCSNVQVPIEGIIGEGNFPNEINSVESCLATGERNSTWMEIPIVSSGRLAFSIVPSGLQDYDFVIFDLTNANCEDIFSNNLLIVSCSFSGSTFPTSATGPNDGLNWQDEEGIWVEAGDRLMLCVTNFTGNMGSGFSIEFAPSNTCVVGACNSITGKVYLDQNSNCNEDQNEVRIPHAKVGILNNGNASQYDTYTNDEGIFNLIYPMSIGEAVIGVVSETPVYSQTCESIPAIIPESSFEQNIANAEIAVDKLLDCYLLHVNQSNPFMRNCLVNNRFFTFTNLGTQTSEATFLTVNYPEYVFPSSNFQNLIYSGSHSFQINIPAIPAFGQFQFTIRDSVDCQTPPGFEVCVSALLDNSTNCEPFEDQALLKITEVCDDFSSNRIITVKNIGVSEVSELRNIQIRTGGQLILNEQLNLSPGDEVTLQTLDMEYATLYMSKQFDSQYIASLTCEVSQVNEYYYNDNLLIPQLSDGATVCDLVRNSYDPNDKTGYPAGEGSEHLISKNDRLKYRIRFQNTGNDTAYKVVVRDTLPDFLDELTVDIGISSHPLRFERHGNELIFVFDPIALVDSATNVEASQGFVEFYINQRANNPDYYTINNSAAIYFDFNEPIITNTYTYNISPLVGIEQAEVKNFEIYPNPGKDILNIKLGSNSEMKNNDLYVRISEFSGRLIILDTRRSDFISLNVSDLSSGLYFVEVFNEEISFGVSKWIKD